MYRETSALHNQNQVMNIRIYTSYHLAAEQQISYTSSYNTETRADGYHHIGNSFLIMGLDLQKGTYTRI